MISKMGAALLERRKGCATIPGSPKSFMSFQWSPCLDFHPLIFGFDHRSKRAAPFKNWFRGHKACLFSDVLETFSVGRGEHICDIQRI
jgi:hypothetical protein